MISAIGDPGGCRLICQGFGSVSSSAAAPPADAISPAPPTIAPAQFVRPIRKESLLRPSLRLLPEICPDSIGPQGPSATLVRAFHPEFAEHKSHAVFRRNGGSLPPMRQNALSRQPLIHAPHCLATAFFP